MCEVSRDIEMHIENQTLTQSLHVNTHSWRQQLLIKTPLSILLHPFKLIQISMLYQKREKNLSTNNVPKLNYTVSNIPQST